MSDRTDPKPDNPLEADPLAAFFDAARAEAPAVSPGLRRRILEDAVAASRKTTRSRPTLSGRWFAGWALPGLAGGVSAGLAGLWLGFFTPLPLMALDVPEWMHEALLHVDAIALPLIWPDDPLLLGM